jgi:UDP-N-acetylglucosamine acyltransferase
VNIHPLALVSPAAELGPGITVGPWCVIEPDVTIGANCVLESSVVIKRGTTLGPDNHLFDGAIIGGLPQHVHMPECPGRVVIGQGNTIREHVTIHRALQADRATMIGDHNLIMVNAHIAHDCYIGNHMW